MRVLVLGAYGLIGLAIARSLHAAGHEVIGVGRSVEQGLRLFPSVRWLAADIAKLQHADQWKPFLNGVDVVVNSAGALQDSARDDLSAIHHTSIAALVSACKDSSVMRVVQISAPGATTESSNEFMRSKARGDAAVRAGGAEWVIFRPGLVIAPNAYGGSALIRMMAAFPLVSPLALSDSRIQTVAISDLCAFVRDAVEERLASGTDIDLVEVESHSLREVVEHFRRWLGAPQPLVSIALPRWTLAPVAFIADVFGQLGWRSPLRTNALRALQENIVGDASHARQFGGSDLLSLAQSFDAMPATLQERWFARLYLMLPLMIATLAIFWLLSGVIGLTNLDQAAAALPASLISTQTANALVVSGAVIDILLGVAILVRPFARKACVGMVAISFGYLVAGSLLAPALWSDPLGPLIKVLPSIVLALVTLALLEER